ncbi:hypothetical protein QJS66_05070 [Kocuria rhizophila]|nr:hypothetical protein QJS66_05070 [Kocuria rhizophila]
MSETVNLPAVSLSPKATVTRWLKQVGERRSAVDEALVEVSTDKVDTEVPLPRGGVVERSSWTRTRTSRLRSSLVVIGTALVASMQDSDSGADTAEESASQDSADDSGDSSEEAQEAPEGRHQAGLGQLGGGHPPALGESVTDNRDPLVSRSARASRWTSPAGGLHRQGQHRGPLPRGRHHPGDQG